MIGPRTTGSCPEPTLVKNAKIWTGLRNRTQVPEADILIDKGLLIGAGSFGYSKLKAYGISLEVVDADGAWVTLGIVDLYSHLGDYASPELEGCFGSGLQFSQGTAQPWLRSLDGLNTHDDAYPKRVRSLLGFHFGHGHLCSFASFVRLSSRISLPPTNLKKYPDFEYDTDKDQPEGEDVSMLDGDNASPEALPDVEDEGADELTSQSTQWEGNEVYKDVITNY
ncbi:hypothetical protein ARMGADRAFT_1082308 [Armillaria gallica]|uniref:Uncharacterized protein n=1 Tax=Armillaria gallica TaxID=47427 RepID=A0A2H3DJS2_ARMGA|nr:hypothetical protein ARMGADRAFT_1082308 [Armillaria gallica]